MKELTQEELEQQIKELDSEYDRFAKTTSLDIMNLIIEEEYPIPVAIGGLTSLIKSIIKIYDLDDLTNNCIEMLQEDYEEIS